MCRAGVLPVYIYALTFEYCTCIPALIQTEAHFMQLQQTVHINEDILILKCPIPVLKAQLRIQIYQFHKVKGFFELPIPNQLCVACSPFKIISLVFHTVE